MKKFFTIFGIVAALLLLAAVGVCLYGYVQMRNAPAGAEQQTQKLAVDAIVAISKDWNPDELKKREHPQLAEAIKKSGQPAEEFFKIYRKLGALKSDVTCALMNYRSNAGIPHYQVASYECKATYENDKAVIYIQLVEDGATGGAFLISTFKIDSPLFIKLLAK